MFEQVRALEAAFDLVAAKFQLKKFDDQPIRSVAELGINRDQMKCDGSSESEFGPADGKPDHYECRFDANHVEYDLDKEKLRSGKEFHACNNVELDSYKSKFGVDNDKLENQKSVSGKARLNSYYPEFGCSVLENEVKRNSGLDCETFQSDAYMGQSLCNSIAMNGGSLPEVKYDVFSINSNQRLEANMRNDFSHVFNKKDIAFHDIHNDTLKSRAFTKNDTHFGSIDNTNNYYSPPIFSSRESFSNKLDINVESNALLRLEKNTICNAEQNSFETNPINIQTANIRLAFPDENVSSSLSQDVSDNDTFRSDLDEASVLAKTSLDFLGRQDLRMLDSDKITDSVNDEIDNIKGNQCLKNNAVVEPTYCFDMSNPDISWSGVDGVSKGNDKINESGIAKTCTNSDIVRNTRASVCVKSTDRDSGLYFSDRSSNVPANNKILGHSKYHAAGKPIHIDELDLFIPLRRVEKMRKQASLCSEQESSSSKHQVFLHSLDHKLGYMRKDMDILRNLLEMKVSSPKVKQNKKCPIKVNRTNSYISKNAFNISGSDSLSSEVPPVPRKKPSKKRNNKRSRSLANVSCPTNIDDHHHCGGFSHNFSAGCCLIETKSRNFVSCSNLNRETSRSCPKIRSKSKKLLCDEACNRNPELFQCDVSRGSCLNSLYTAHCLCRVCEKSDLHLEHLTIKAQKLTRKSTELLKTMTEQTK